LVSEKYGIKGNADEVHTLADGTMAPLDYKFARYDERLFKTSLVVEGYQSSGKADVTSMTITVGNAPSTSSPPGPTPEPTPRSAFSKIEAEEYNSSSHQPFRP